MIKELKEFFAKRRVRKLFPKIKEKFWYCGEIYTYSYDLDRAGKPSKTSEMELPCEKFIINPYSDAGGKVPQVGDIIPCIKIDGWIGFYLVTKKDWYSHYGDFAMWDDGKAVDLKLHHCERATPRASV